MRKPLFVLSAVLITLGAAGSASRIYAQATPISQDKTEIEALEKRYIDAFNAKDVNAIMACY
jgi:ketosteroid isomerase-like protein